MEYDINHNYELFILYIFINYDLYLSSSTFIKFVPLFNAYIRAFTQFTLRYNIFIEVNISK